MNDDIKEMMTLVVSRKQFLQMVGVGLLSVFGITNFISNILKNRPGQKRAQPMANASLSHGFGSRTFGN